MKLSKVLAILCTIAIVVAATFTTVQTAYAYSIPTGCRLTSYTKGCGACGWFWQYGGSYETWKWKCTSGATGSHAEYGPCGDCKP